MEIKDYAFNYPFKVRKEVTSAANILNISGSFTNTFDQRIYNKIKKELDKSDEASLDTSEEIINTI